MRLAKINRYKYTDYAFGGFMRKALVFLMVFLLGSALWAQQNSAPQKFALVIGNGAYTGISRLNNPVNDADDMATTLSDLGFQVDKVLNGSLDDMENAVVRLRDRLGVSRNSYGFFFYAGHGVQSNGENFLIPVDSNIQSEGNLRLRAVSVQAMLDDLNDAGNELNIIVLDACRDNPFGWNRSAGRGLAMVAKQPADSIVVYSTSAGSVAADGSGRNGLFTEHLLNNLKIPGIEVNDVFRRTMGDVARNSNNQQRPAVYSQFSEIAYLGSYPGDATYIPAQPYNPPVQTNPIAGPEDQKPSTGIKYGFINLALGLGSYIQGDTIGGVIVTSGYAAALGLLAWELSLSYSDSMAGIPGPIAIGLAGATMAFGFVKPVLYNKSHQLASVMDKVDISLVSIEQNNIEQNKTALRIGYTHRF